MSTQQMNLRSLIYHAEAVRTVATATIEPEVNRLIAEKVIGIRAGLDLHEQFGKIEDEINKFKSKVRDLLREAKSDDLHAVHLSLDTDPEPAGVRDTFVPREACMPGNGPDAERFNPLQD